MKKALLSFVTIAILIALTGCSDSSIDKIEKTSQTQSENSIPDSENKDASIINTKYYTIEIPSSWEVDCFYEITESENYALTFYDKASHEETNEGRLFSIKLLTDTEDYSVYPEYEILGSIDVHRVGSYNVLVTYPTDVQFSENTVAKYTELTGSIPDILKTISFNDACTFSKEPLPVAKVEESKPQIFKRFIGRWKDLGIGSRAPGGASKWNIEFREDGTGTFEFIFEANDIVTVDFEFEPFDTYLGETMDGILIHVDSGTDVSYMTSYGWSNELQKMLMTLYEVKTSGAPNLDAYRVFANE